MQTERGYVDTVREGESGTKWEIRIEIYTFPCVTEGTSGNLLESTEAQLSDLR